MKNNKGITLIILVITIIILLILTGVIVSNINNTYDSSRVIQFTSYMKMIQKRVDLYVEERANYQDLGQTLSSDTKTKLQSIINSDTNNLIYTDDIESETLRYFDSDDIDEFFDISNINDEIVINFANREVISLNGVEKDSTIYYTSRGL